MEKRCRKCDQVKSLDEFHRSSSAPDGRQYRCKICSIAAARQRAISNPEAAKAANAKYMASEKYKATRKARREGAKREVILQQKRDSYARNKDEINDRMRNKRWDTPEIFSAYERTKRERHRDSMNSWNREYQMKNREKIRYYQRERIFGLTAAVFDAMLEAQNDLCAICGVHMESRAETVNGRKRTGVQVDHCHTTGVVRGLLCSACNKALGLMRDDPEALRAAADYVEKYRAAITV